MSNLNKKEEIFEQLIDKLSTEELYRYLRLFASSYYMARHDIGGNDIQVIKTYGGLFKEKLQSFIQTVKNLSDNNEYFEQLRKLENYSNELVDASMRLQKKVDNFFSLHSSEDIGDRSLLITCPYEIIQKAQSPYPLVKFELSPETYKTLHIPFPNSILFGIVNELIKNAANNSEKNCKIIVDCNLSSNGFTLKIQDNNKIGDQIRLRSFFPIGDFKDICKIEKSSEGGLDLINRLISLSGGSLLFSRSDILKGLLVQIHIPIKYYILNDKIDQIGDI